MKPKTLFILTFVAFNLQCAYSQLSLGICSGLNLPTVKFYNLNFAGVELEEGIRPDFFVGLSPKYEIYKRISVRLDIQYSRKGYKVSNIGSDDSKFRYEYIDVIPEIDFKLFSFLSFGTGVNTAFLIQESQKFDNTWYSGDNLETIQVFDFGLVGTIRGEFKNFNVFFRYNHGLSNITNILFTNFEGYPIRNVQQKNKNFQVGIDYEFSFGKNK